MSKLRPNILFFFTDQQRWDTCGCYGQQLPVTPNLDRLAADGVKFEYAFTCQPVCGPARACLQTGKFATETGNYINGMALPLDEKTIAHFFNENHFETAYIGKWHLAASQLHDFRTAPVPRNYRGGWKDEWVAADTLEWTSQPYEGKMYDADGNPREFRNQYRVDAQTDWALEYLQHRKTADPFCLFISYLEPHHQNDLNASVGPEGSRERFKDFPVPPDLADTGGSWRGEYPDYLGCCNSLDYNLGRIVAELKRQGIYENTVIVYTSDHGSHFRTRNAEYKRSCHDGCIRIPMVLCGPGFKGGKVISELVSLIDLPPTLLAAAGIEIPDYMRGRPLQPLADGFAADWPREVFIQISEDHNGRAVRTRRWKYEVWNAPELYYQFVCGKYVERFLYDLEQDPHEKNNLVKDPAYRDIRRELAYTLSCRMAAAGEAPPVILPA